MTQLNIGDEQIDEVVCIPDGIITASWSPNEEHYLVVQGDGKLVCFNTLFDMVSSVELDDNDETFAPGQEVTQDMRAIKQAEITWRADSRIFAISYGINGGTKCLTRDTDMNIIKGPARADKENVAEKNVFSVSEKPIKNMRLPIAMMPNGSLIAGFQVTVEEGKDDKSEIIFWEKNGLRHGQIELPKFNGHLPCVQKLKFNSDTSFVAALLSFKGDRSTDNTIPESQIIILHRSNYHWFIKRSIELIQGIEIHDFHWLANKKNQLMIVDKKANFSFFDFQFVYQTSSDISFRNFDHLSYTANVDFTKLLITPFRKVVIPPPLAEKEIELIEIPKTICFYRNNIFVIFRSKIGFLNCESGEIQYLDFKYQGVAKAALFLESDTPSEGVDGVLLVNTCVHNKKKDTIIELLLKQSASGQIEIVKTHKQPSNKVYSWCSSPHKYYDEDQIDFEDKEHNKLYTSRKTENREEEETNPTMAMFLGQQNEDEEEKVEHEKCIYIQYLSKKLQRYFPALLSEEGEAEVKDIWFELPHVCFQLSAAYLTGELCIVSLSNTSKLSINGKLFSKECTSMLLTRDFLFFINSTQTLFHSLYVYNLKKKLPLPVLDSSEPDATKMIPKLPTADGDSFHVRNVERGARLVCCNLTKTIIQMPRGNLEGKFYLDK